MNRLNCLRGIFFLLSLLILGYGCTEQSPRILVFTKTAGFKHESIPAGVAALKKLARDNNFTIDTTKNAELFTKANLAKYNAVVFLSTTGDVLNSTQEDAFKQYINAGGGFVGIHAATDTEKDWEWYIKMVGAQFLNHPAGVHQADFKVMDKSHAATAFIQQVIWKRTDELYNFTRFNDDVKVLLTVDESTYEGGQHGDFHPMAWYHEYDGGRAFYTAGGHTAESFEEPMFLQHILGGIQYAIGEEYAIILIKEGCWRWI